MHPRCTRLPTRRAQRHNLAAVVADTPMTEQILIEHLTNPAWLEARGLLFVASACDASGFDVTVDGDAATVRPKQAPPSAAFRLHKSGESWRIVGLPK